MIWVYCNTLNVVLVNSSQKDIDLEALDYVGIVVMVVGLAYEIIGDQQKQAWKNSDASKDAIICDVGLWGHTRHPNYFGEMFFWVGAFLSSLPVVTREDSYFYIAVLSPLMTIIILLFLGGLPTAEGSALKKYYKNEEYVFLQLPPPCSASHPIGTRTLVITAGPNRRGLHTRSAPASSSPSPPRCTLPCPCGSSVFSAWSCPCMSTNPAITRRRSAQTPSMTARSINLRISHRSSMVPRLALIKNRFIPVLPNILGAELAVDSWRGGPYRLAGCALVPASDSAHTFAEYARAAAIMCLGQVTALMQQQARACSRQRRCPSAC